MIRSDYGPMTISEWRAEFAKLPEPTIQALADYVAWCRGEITSVEYEARLKLTRLRQVALPAK